MEKIKRFFQAMYWESLETIMSIVWMIFAVLELFTENGSIQTALLCIIMSTIFNVTATIKKEIQNAKK